MTIEVYRGALVGGTAAEFVVEWMKDNYMTFDDFVRSGRIPYYCGWCVSYDFPHWEMGRVTDDAFDRRHEIEPPA